MIGAVWSGAAVFVRAVRKPSVGRSRFRERCDLESGRGNGLVPASLWIDVPGSRPAGKENPG